MQREEIIGLLAKISTNIDAIKIYLDNYLITGTKNNELSDDDLFSGIKSAYRYILNQADEIGYMLDKKTMEDWKNGK